VSKPKQKQWMVVWVLNNMQTRRTTTKRTIFYLSCFLNDINYICTSRTLYFSSF